MPKLVSEISAGSSNERSVDGGRNADSSTRNWRIILNSPSEAYDIQQEIGVRIGDPHPVNTGVPCISISERADGDSRLVRLVTATYRTTPSEDPNRDPNQDPPDIRPAKFSISSSLIEVPATQWRQFGEFWGPNNPAADFFGNPNRGAGALLAAEDALNPVGDRYDGVTKLVPLINISIEQFDNFPTQRLGDAGKVNNDNFEFLGLQVQSFTCMLRSIAVRPHVESFGDFTYRGFMRTFEFSIKTHGGWLIDQILEGFNIKNNGLGVADVDQGALNLAHLNGKVIVPEQLEPELVDKKCRARVMISAPEGGKMQRPSSQPVALNANGTPRNVETAVPKVLRRLYCTQGDVAFGKNFSGIGIRLHEII